MKELSTESQKKSFLDWLSEGNTITALQALNITIANEMIEVNGKRVAQYWLQRAR